MFITLYIDFSFESIALCIDINIINPFYLYIKIRMTILNEYFYLFIINFNYIYKKY